MADPATTTAAAGVAAGATISALAIQLGVPMPTIIFAVIGAALAVIHSDRVKWSRAGVWTGIGSFALALAFGAAGGHFAALMIVGVLAKWPGIAIPYEAASGLTALVLALQGQSVILPALAKRFGVEIESRGASK